MTALNKGDYVIATKYGDGDPNDPWCIGFFASVMKERYDVVDHNGQSFRLNGFRRIKKITKERGQWILNHRNEMEQGKHSVWWWVRTKMSDDC
jgi:hypothetical protein